MGFSSTTTVLAAAVSQDLTDLATVRDEIGIANSPDTSKDAWLLRAIRQVSAAIAQDTNRVFAPELVQETFDIERDNYPYQTPGGFATLQLSRWPVLSIVSMVQTPSPSSTQTLVEDVDFRADPQNGQLRRLNPFSGSVSTWESLPVTVVYMAGYGALVQEVQTVPGTPYHVTVAQSAAFSCDQAVSYASGAALARVTANPAAAQYSVAAGIYILNAADTAKPLTFAYGVKAIPDDLVDICLRLVTGRYAAKGRDPSLIQRESAMVGTERFWFGSAPGQKGSFPPDIQSMLDNYSVPVIA